LLTNSNIQEEDEELWKSEQVLVGFRHWREIKQRILDKVVHFLC